jgi:hypothetical protein
MTLIPTDPFFGPKPKAGDTVERCGVACRYS